MRWDWNITITDYRGARHFKVTGPARHKIKSAIASSMFALGLMLTMLINQALSNQDLKQELLAVQEHNSQLERRTGFLLAEQKNLVATIELRSRRLASLDSNIDHLENLLALHDDTDASLEIRVSTAYDAFFEKQLLLRSIPRLSPVPFKAITDRYGIRRHPLKGSTGMHHGVDLRAAMRTPVNASADGIVIKAGRYSNGLGKMIEIQHRYGFSTIYGHLDSIGVKPGDIIHQGDVIARSGNTGISTAPHLHYEVHYLGERIDPQPFLDWDLQQYDNLITREQDVPWESLQKAIVTTVRRRLDQGAQPIPVAQRSLRPTARLTAASP